MKINSLHATELRPRNVIPENYVRVHIRKHIVRNNYKFVVGCDQGRKVYELSPGHVRLVSIKLIHLQNIFGNLAQLHSSYVESPV
jgi:hypothetical protein